tara:strand:- start:260 stop:454 length:195 start_codon:yes stop_codon:yes gene_type:complete
MKITSAKLGVVLTVVGATMTGYHTHSMLKVKKYDSKSLFWALTGIVSFGIGQDLIADNLHDRFK